MNGEKITRRHFLRYIGQVISLAGISKLAGCPDFFTPKNRTGKNETTCVEITDSRLPSPDEHIFDGLSLSELLMGKKHLGRDAPYFHMSLYDGFRMNDLSD